MLKALFAVVLVFGTAIYFASLIAIAKLSRIETLLHEIKEQKGDKHNV